MYCDSRVTKKWGKYVCSTGIDIYTISLNFKNSVAVNKHIISTITFVYRDFSRENFMQRKEAEITFSVKCGLY